MKVLKFSLLVSIIAIFTSCDCLLHVKGIVIDAETRMPIDNVVIKEKDTDRVLYTDKLGNFEFGAMKIGLLTCPKTSLSFEKEGYVKTSKKYKSCCADNVVVVLEKLAK